MQRGNTWDLKWTCVLKIPNLQVISLGGLLPLHLGELRGFLTTNWLQQLLILAALLLGGVQSCSSSKTGRCEIHRFGAAFCETQEAVCSWLSLMDSQNNVKICRRIDLATNPPKPYLLGQKHVKQVGQQPQEDHLRLRLASICLVCFPSELVRPRTRKTSAVSSATTTSSSDGLGQSLRALRWVCVCVWDIVHLGLLVIQLELFLDLFTIDLLQHVATPIAAAEIAGFHIWNLLEPLYTPAGLCFCRLYCALSDAMLKWSQHDEVLRMTLGFCKHWRWWKAQVFFGCFSMFVLTHIESSVDHSLFDTFLSHGKVHTDVFFVVSSYLIATRPGKAATFRIASLRVSAKVPY